MAKTGGAAQQAAIAIHEKEASSEKASPPQAVAKKSASKKSTGKKTTAKKSLSKAAATQKTATRTSAAKKTETRKTSNKMAGKQMEEPPGKRAASMPKDGKDPRGGLTAAGRKYYNDKTGGHLQAGVKGPADTPEKKRRKGSFLTRHFTTPPGPVVKDGRPTRQALQAAAWGEPVPKTEADEQKLAEKGRKLLQEAKGE